MRSAPPKILEAVRRHFGVPDRVLDVLVPEIVLEGPRVVSFGVGPYLTITRAYVGKPPLAVALDGKRYLPRWQTEPHRNAEGGRNDHGVWHVVGHRQDRNYGVRR